MTTSTISSKGQITLPAAMRQKLGIKPGDRVIVEAKDNTIVVRRAPDFFAFKGVLGKALPLEEERRLMAEGVAKHVLGKD